MTNTTSVLRLAQRCRHALVGVTVALSSMVLAHQALGESPTIESIDFTSRASGQFEIQLGFDQVPPDFKGYTVEKPARIAIDFTDTSVRLDQKKYSLPYGNASSVMVVESGGRARLVVNLPKLVPYETRTEGNSLFITVGDSGTANYLKPNSEPNALSSRVETVIGATTEINDLQFQRTPEGEGRLILTLSDPKVDVNVFSEAGDIKLEFKDAAVPERLLRRFDVADFATPVHSVEVKTTKKGTVLTLKTAENTEYQTHQTDNQFVLSVKTLSADEMDKRRNEFAYVGDRISLNFQDIEVRAVLQLIADFTELNLVASDTVTGRITLRLQNVPWDQALELVLKTRGLDQRQIGNVLMIAPAEEISERERQQIEANKQIAELAPLSTEFIRVRYAKANEVVDLFSAGSEDGGSLISARGSVIVDPRTNSLIVTETAAKLTEIRSLIDLVDIPIRQVMIEARIVIAQSSLDEELGIRWGGGHTNTNFGGNALSVSGDTANVSALNQAMIDGTPGALSYPGALLVDLGVAEPAGSFAVGFTSKDVFLTAELSALEAVGKGEVVSQPKVITGDKQKASIKSGTEVPYQESSAGGATATQFKEAVLQLDVTPNITPDDRILLDLIINQDSIGELVPSGNGGSIPTIDTTQLTTQVLVGNGETIVLGGVFRTEDLEKVSKVPILGDLPVMGQFFRSSSTSRTKTETLIFITPRILADSLLD